MGKFIATGMAGGKRGIAAIGNRGRRAAATVPKIRIGTGPTGTSLRTWTGIEIVPIATSRKTWTGIAIVPAASGTRFSPSSGIAATDNSWIATARHAREEWNGSGRLLSGKRPSARRLVVGDFCVP
jgi:hypothetical protein